MVGFTLGLVIGAVIGYVTCALLSINGSIVAQE